MKKVEAAGFLVYRVTGAVGAGSMAIQFLLLRNAKRQEWGFPKGHVDAGDSDILATAVRELKEETGLSDVLLHTGFRERITYPIPDGEIKTVTYFLARCEGENVDISGEHDAQVWAEVAQCASMLGHESLRGVLSASMRFLRERESISDLL